MKKAKKKNKKFIVLYVDDCTPKQKKFSSKKEALAFVDPVVKANSDTFWISGLVIGEYVEGQLDGKDVDILDRLE